MSIRKNRIVALLMTLMVGLCASGVMEASVVTSTEGAGVIGGLIVTVVLVMIASALMPTIANQSAVASADLTTEGFDSASSIVDQWPLGVAIAVFIGVFSSFVIL